MHDGVVGLRIMESTPLSWPKPNFDQIVQLLIIFQSMFTIFVKCGR